MRGLIGSLIAGLIIFAVAFLIVGQPVVSDPYACHDGSTKCAKLIRSHTTKV